MEDTWATLPHTGKTNPRVLEVVIPLGGLPRFRWDRIPGGNVTKYSRSLSCESIRKTGYETFPSSFSCGVFRGERFWGSASAGPGVSTQDSWTEWLLTEIFDLTILKVHKSTFT
jgi:hypothetical protein